MDDRQDVQVVRTDQVHDAITLKQQFPYVGALSFRHLTSNVRMEANLSVASTIL